MKKNKNVKIEKIILSGGGTGGHIYPALSIYRQLKQDNPNIKCVYIGTNNGLEAEIVKKIDDIQFESIKISGLKRALTLSNLKVVWQMLNSTQQAKKIIERFDPDLVIGTGGFVCAPVVYAASNLNIPTLIHEQNSVAGITNKFLSRKVTKIATSFLEVHKDFAKHAEKIVYTGNPRGQEVSDYPERLNILSKSFQLMDNIPTVLIFGGSRGAPAINKAAVDSILDFSKEKYQVIIGTGSVHFDEWLNYLKDNNITLPQNVKMVSYIEDMPALLKKITLVVSRSGATTISELTSLGLPSILIPSPYVTNNHQEHNAMALVNKGAASIIKEVDLSEGSLVKEINKLMHDESRLEDMALQAKTMGTPNATDKIIEVLYEII